MRSRLFVFGSDPSWFGFGYTHTLRTCTHIGFDDYYKSLRPRLRPEDCSNMDENKPHPNDPTLQINCRNIWFNEFWSQHHKCSFEKGAAKQCTGNETLTNYEQEGLVPFVGKIYYLLSSFFYCCCFFFRAPARFHCLSHRTNHLKHHHFLLGAHFAINRM